MMGSLSKNKIITPEDVEFKLAQLREFSNTLKERIHNTKSVNSDGHQSNSIAPISEDSRNVNVTKISSVPNEEKSKNLSDLIHSSNKGSDIALLSANTDITT